MNGEPLLIVVDTNILVNALKSRKEGAKSRRLIKDILIGKYKMCLSEEIVGEYEDVLHRPQLQLPYQEVEVFLSWIKLNGFWIEPLPTTTERIKMGDEDDRCFFDVAKCLGAPLITRNYTDYPVHELITLIDDLY